MTSVILLILLKQKKRLDYESREEEFENPDKRFEALARIDQVPMADQHADRHASQEKRGQNKAQRIHNRFHGQERGFVETLCAQYKPCQAYQQGKRKGAGPKLPMLSPKRQQIERK